MIGWVALTLTLTLTLALGAGDAGQCRERFEALKLRDATAACTRALRTTPVEQHAELYRMLAFSLATLGDEEGAKAAFVSLLAVDPSFALDESVSPRFRALLAAARSDGNGRRVTLLLSGPARPLRDAPVLVEVRLEDGPCRPVTSLHLQSGSTERRWPRQGDLESIELMPPLGAATLGLRVEALDRFGGALALQTLELSLAVAHPPRPWPWSWKAWGGAAAGSGALGVVAGLLSRAATSQARTDAFESDAAADIGRARQEAIAANVCFGAAAALGVGALVLLATEHRSDP